MKSLYFLFITIILFSGCKSNKKFDSCEEAWESLEGQSYDDIVKRWGEPSYRSKAWDRNAGLRSEVKPTIAAQWNNIVEGITISLNFNTLSLSWGFEPHRIKSYTCDASLMGSTTDEGLGESAPGLTEIYQENTNNSGTPPPKTDENAITESAEPLISENIANEIQPFLPKDYSVLNATKGNLNLDKIEDLILIIKKNNEEITSNVIEAPEKRPLLILIGQPDGTYKIAGKNDNVVYCVDCGGAMGDPFSGVTIKNGFFSIEHYGGSAWRWTRIVTFKFSSTENNWFLSRDGGDSYHATKPDEIETKIRTVKDFGRVPFGDFDIYKEEE